MHSSRFYLVLALFALLIAPAAEAQYVFLDANGDGVNDSSDQLNATGPTNLDIWFVTDHNRDGSPAGCKTDPTEPMTINSYEIVLVATHGTLRFGPLVNRLPFSGQAACFASYDDTTNASVYHNGWGYRDIMPPGRYLVATLTVEILDGSPSLSFAGRSPLAPVDLTSFGTKCTGVDYDNTYILGEEFSDASGIGRPAAEAGGPYIGVVDRPITFDGSGSSTPDGDPLDFAWSFDDGGAATGAVASHAFSAVGAHTATLTVTSALSGSDTDQAAVSVVAPFKPVANAGGPYQGRPGAPVPFNGSLSYDPDNDPLSYEWTFGDGSAASGVAPHKIYDTAGTYAVELTVRDANDAATDQTTATIAEPVNHFPIASAGGPYHGIVGRWIQFDATGSTDPDGDFLSFIWDFGDNIRGIGIVAAHAYKTAGTFDVNLTASDGLSTANAQSQATIVEGLLADAFFDGDRSVVNVDDADEFVAIRFQPVDGSFHPDDIDPDRVALRVQTLDNSTVDLDPAHAVILQDDSDHDGVVEFVAIFPRAAFRDLVADESIRGRTHLQLLGGLNRGGSCVADFDGTFVRANQFDLVVTPNPFNPIAHVIIRTKTSGAVTARLYDVRGRQVRTLMRGETIQAGRHDLVFEARDDAGAQLASGIYFLQVISPDGARTGRVVVAK